MEIQFGIPPIDGRYVVLVRCKSLQVRNWCEPKIDTWHKGRWHGFDEVLGWIGPLPAVSVSDLEQLQMEYDL